MSTAVRAEAPVEQLEVGDGDREPCLDDSDVVVFEELAQGQAVVERDRRGAGRVGLFARA